MRRRGGPGGGPQPLGAAAGESAMASVRSPRGPAHGVPLMNGRHQGVHSESGRPRGGGGRAAHPSRPGPLLLECPRPCSRRAAGRCWDACLCWGFSRAGCAVGRAGERRHLLRAGARERSGAAICRPGEARGARPRRGQQRPPHTTGSRAGRAGPRPPDGPASGRLWTRRRGRTGRGGVGIAVWWRWRRWVGSVRVEGGPAGRLPSSAESRGRPGRRGSCGGLFAVAGERLDTLRSGHGYMDRHRRQKEERGGLRSSGGWRACMAGGAPAAACRNACR